MLSCSQCVFTYILLICPIILSGEHYYCHFDFIVTLFYLSVFTRWKNSIGKIGYLAKHRTPFLPCPPTTEIVLLRSPVFMPVLQPVHFALTNTHSLPPISKLSVKASTTFDMQNGAPFTYCVL